MEKLITTNNVVTLSFIKSLLKDADIPYVTSSGDWIPLEGEPASHPETIMVSEDDLPKAVKILKKAGIDK